MTLVKTSKKIKTSARFEHLKISDVQVKFRKRFLMSRGNFLGSKKHNQRKLLDCVVRTASYLFTEKFCGFKENSKNFGLHAEMTNCQGREASAY